MTDGCCCKMFLALASFWGTNCSSHGPFLLQQGAEVALKVEI